MELSLQARSHRAEIMDGCGYSKVEYIECLRQLRLLNVLTSGYQPTLKAIESFAKTKTAPGPLRILDIGFGYGDTLREIARWARRANIDVELTGIDINPLSEEAASEVTPRHMPIRYITGDVFQHSPDQPYDVVINALFMHHMDDSGMVRILNWMAENSKQGFFINDLHRHPIAYVFIRHFTRVLGFNRMIRHDAPLSVARSFLASEWRDYAKRAGLDLCRLRVRWYWTFRYGVRYEHAR